MSAVRSFCTDLARERGEPHEGTGALSNRFLLFRWPRGKWRVPWSGSAGLPPAIADAMAHAEQKGGWIVLVDGSDADVPALMSFPEAVCVEGGEAELAAALRAWADGVTLGGRPIGRQVILACVDSRTDACCARVGFPTYRALADTADPPPATSSCLPTRAARTSTSRGRSPKSPPAAGPAAPDATDRRSHSI